MNHHVPTLLTASVLAIAPSYAQTAPPTPRTGPALYPPVLAPSDLPLLGGHIQRTMTLLATSTPQQRHRVKILFYGQSITQQEWTREVADDLRRRFPYADLTIENRAIGGFAAQLLKWPAEFDLYPFYPDLVIFHVYGNHLDYESIISNIRSRTTAEILMQTDHVVKDDALSEETDPAKLAPTNWDAWMNNAFLPQTAQKYGAELAQVHNGWKEYLRANGLKAPQLLSDQVHLNQWGNFVMARQIEPYLRYEPGFSDATWRHLVEDVNIGSDANWQNGRLKIEFYGNRIEAIAAPSRAGSLASAQVLIDGKRPSQFPELTVFKRPSGTPNVGWPGLIRLASQSPLVPEEWTVRITEINADASKFTFEVFGSVTGPDGSGSSESKFVSRSGRVVIEPQNWYLHSDYELSKKGTPVGWEIKWKAVPLYADVLQTQVITDQSRESATTLAQGLTNELHTLELIADGPEAVPLKSIRVYRPSLR